MKKYRCLNCEDEFDFDLEEVVEFIKRRADIGYLRKKFEKIELACKSFGLKSEAFKQFNSIDQILFFFISYHCPYCREVNLSKHEFSPDYPKDTLTDEQYLKALEKEMRHRGDIQIKKEPFIP